MNFAEVVDYSPEKTVNIPDGEASPGFIFGSSPYSEPAVARVE